MILFVDLTSHWLCPACAFLSSTMGIFADIDGAHVATCKEDLDSIDMRYRERCKALVPEGFWDRPDVEVEAAKKRKP